jgi:RND family efflux transporter MFP subunit
MKHASRVAIALLPLLGCSKEKPEEEPKPVVTVKLATAELQDVRLSVSAPALVHARQQTNVASRLTANIRELLARKGDRVGAGVVLAKLDDRDLQGQRAEVMAALRQAEILTARRSKLFEEGAIPQRDLLATQTELATQKAKLEQVDTQLKFSELRSPFAGTLTEQFLYPGDMAKPDAPVFTIADLDVAVARAQVPESDAGALRAGQQCLFAGSDDPEHPFEGKLGVINRAVDPLRRTVEAWCEIPNKGARLLPGVFGELNVVTGVARQSVVVPVAAVEFEEGTKKGTVTVVDAQKLTHRKEVQAGETFEGKVQIVEGLKQGEQVVVEGGYGLEDGTAVKIATKEKEEKEEKQK